MQSQPLSGRPHPPPYRPILIPPLNSSLLTWAPLNRGSPPITFETVLSYQLSLLSKAGRSNGSKGKENAIGVYNAHLKACNDSILSHYRICPDMDKRNFAACAAYIRIIQSAVLTGEKKIIDTRETACAIAIFLLIFASTIAQSAAAFAKARDQYLDDDLIELDNLLDSVEAQNLTEIRMLLRQLREVLAGPKCLSGISTMQGPLYRAVKKWLEAYREGLQIMCGLAPSPAPAPKPVPATIRTVPFTTAPFPHPLPQPPVATTVGPSPPASSSPATAAFIQKWLPDVILSDSESESGSDSNNEADELGDETEEDEGFQRSRLSTATPQESAALCRGTRREKEGLVSLLRSPISLSSASTTPTSEAGDRPTINEKALKRFKVSSERSTGIPDTLAIARRETAPPLPPVAPFRPRPLQIAWRCPDPTPTIAQRPTPSSTKASIDAYCRRVGVRLDDVVKYFAKPDYGQIIGVGLKRKASGSLETEMPKKLAAEGAGGRKGVESPYPLLRTSTSSVILSRSACAPHSDSRAAGTRAQLPRVQPPPTPSPTPPLPSPIKTHISALPRRAGVASASASSSTTASAPGRPTRPPVTAPPIIGPTAITPQIRLSFIKPPDVPVPGFPNLGGDSLTAKGLATSGVGSRRGRDRRSDWCRLPSKFKRIVIDSPHSGSLWRPVYRGASTFPWIGEYNTCSPLSKNHFGAEGAVLQLLLMTRPDTQLDQTYKFDAIRLFPPCETANFLKFTLTDRLDREDIGRDFMRPLLIDFANWIFHRGLADHAELPTSRSLFDMIYRICASDRTEMKKGILSDDLVARSLGSKILALESHFKALDMTQRLDWRRMVQYYWRPAEQLVHFGLHSDDVLDP